MSWNAELPDPIAAAFLQAVFHKFNGRPDEASAWAAELCGRIGCGDIINTRGKELRRDFHTSRPNEESNKN